MVNDFGVPLPTAVLTYGPSANPTTNAGTPSTTNFGGTINLAASGNFTYTPATGFSGTDQFKYITGNGNLPNNDAIVSITVAPDITFSTTPTNPLCNGNSNGSIVFSASGGSGTFNYSITGAAGTYQLSNSFTGLPAGTYNPAVKDAVGYIKTGAPITLTNPAAIVVSGTIPNLSYNAAMATATFTKTGGTGTISWSATGLPTGISISNLTGDVTGTPTQTGVFNTVITATDINNCTGTKNVSFNVAPNIVGNSYAVVGNTQLVSDGHSSPTTPFTADGTNILTNDQSNAAITITAVTNATTVNNGTITITANGKFTYSPPVGFTGADTYVYTGTSNGVSATATITFNVANVIWYVNNTYAGANGTANGTSHRPYTDVASAETASAINQTIYVHTGSGNTTGAAALKSGQSLIGAGSALNIGTLSIGAGTKPTLSGGITLANNITATGFDMSTAGANAITGTSVTGVSVNIGNVTATTGAGIVLGGAGNNVSITFASLTNSGAMYGATILSTAGSVNINGGTITNSTAAAFNISGGTLSLTYSGSVSQSANAPMVNVTGGHATGTILFQTGTLDATNGSGLQFDNADGTYNFNGTANLHGGGTQVNIGNGSAGAFSFNNTTSITSPTDTAFAIVGGTAGVTYNGNITQANNFSTVAISGGHNGTITFQAGTINASGGNGLQFDNADGNYNFNGAANLNGGDAGIDIINGSGGNFSFLNAPISNPTNAAFVVNGGGGSIGHTGTISKSTAGRLIRYPIQEWRVSNDYG